MSQDCPCRSTAPHRFFFVCWIAALGLLVFTGRTGWAAAPAGQAIRPPLRGPQPPREIKSRELLAEREGLKLKLYEKWRTGNEDTWKQSGKVILLVHGATWASRCTFDPEPERGYSLMEVLADAGFDVFAIDLHGYGKSDRAASPDDWTDAQSAAKDVDAAVEFIRSFRWVDKVHVLGYQWGTHPVSLYAGLKPGKVAKLVLLGARWRQPEYGGAAPTSPVRVLGQQAALLKPDDGDLDPDLVRRRAQVCRAESTQAPSGALRDLAKPTPIEPAKITAPTLLIQGERDGGGDLRASLAADRMNLLRELGSKDKWYVVLGGMGKYLPIERAHARFDQVLLNFLEAPPAP